MAPTPPPDTSSEPVGLDDDALAARVRAGDTAAFGELVARHQQAALRVAAVIIGSTEDARDVVQEAMVKAHRSLATHRGDGSVRSWLLRIVANEAKNHVRSRVRRLRRDDRYVGLEIRTTAGADEPALERIDHAALATALGGLRHDDRAVLGCRFVAGLSEAETAAVLGLPTGTVKSRTSRALGRLRTLLGPIAAVVEGDEGNEGDRT
jgi:RNA polymerase sigma factor (sigma-70 family)